MGTALVVPRRLLELTGGFDRRFFSYFEDVAFSFRARSLGYELVVTRLAAVSHRHSASTVHRPGLKHYLLTRNSILFARRYLRGVRRLTFLAGAPVFYLGLALSRTPSPSTLAAWARGLAHGLAGR